MSGSGAHWGELEEPPEELMMFPGPRANFSALIDLALAGGGACDGWAARRGKAQLLQLPLPSPTLEVARLTEHARLSAAAAASGEPPPPLPPVVEPPLHHHTPEPPLRHVEKDYCPWSRGVGALAQPLSSADCRYALMAAAALSLASNSSAVSAPTSVLETLADATDNFLRMLTLSLRATIDQDAQGNTSGFPDAISKVFSDLGIEGLGTWQANSVASAQRQAKAARLAAEVPQLHFPAGLEDLGAQLAPGFRMLRSLESGELPELRLLQTDQDSPDASSMTSDLNDI